MSFKPFNTPKFKAFPSSAPSSGSSSFNYTYEYAPVVLTDKDVQLLFRFLNEAVQQTQQYKALLRLDDDHAELQRIMRHMTVRDQHAYRLATTDVDMYQFAFDIPQYGLLGVHSASGYVTLADVMQYVLSFLRKHEADAPDSVVWHTMRERLEAFMDMLNERIAVRKSPERPYYKWREAGFVHGSERADALVQMLRNMIVFFPKAFWETFWRWALVKASNPAEYAAHAEAEQVVRFLYDRVFVPLEMNQTHSGLRLAQRALAKIQQSEVQTIPLSPVGRDMIQHLFTKGGQSTQQQHMSTSAAADSAAPSPRGRKRALHAPTTMHALCSRFQMLL